MALTFNPDGHVVRDGRTLAEIIADEEYLEAEEPVKEEKEEKPEKKFKFMSFELDMTYPRTLRGFIRFLQVLLLLVAFICLVITPWPSHGVYSFYCVFLVIGTVISGALFFFVLAGLKKKTLCGFGWVKLELLYFFVFGILIFIGACLAASNSENNPALNASAAFGLIGTITFALYIFWTWKEYKNPPDEEDADKEKDPDKSDVESQQGEKSSQGLPGTFRSDRISVIDPPGNENGDLRIDAPIQRRDENKEFGRPGQQNSLNNGPRPFERTASTVSRNRLIDPQVRKGTHGSQRRPHSGSDKDSAYSEGSILDGDRSLPMKMRRTASARLDDRRRNQNHGKRPDWGQRGSHKELNGWNQRSLSVEMLDDVNGRQRKTVPSWLRAALDCENDPELGPRHASTMPAPRRNEFPLLTLSDEESIAYPSVSQNQGNGVFAHERTKNHRMKGVPHNQRRGHRRHGRRPTDGLHVHHGQHRHHHPIRGGQKGGKHFHGHDMRRSGRGRGAGHGHQRMRHGHRGGRHGNAHHPNDVHARQENRVPPGNEEFLRRMIENDQLVNFNGRGKDKGMPYPAANGDSRRLYPKQPGSIHFPETSRWDDNEQANLPGEHGNMINKYLNGQ